MHGDSKILLNLPPPEASPSYKPLLPLICPVFRYTEIVKYRPLERDNLVVYYFSASKNWTDKR
jgi:hypothetical protein